LGPPPTTFPVSKLDRRHTENWERETNADGKGGGARSWIIRRRESLVLYKSLNSLCSNMKDSKNICLLSRVRFFFTNVKVLLADMQNFGTFCCICKTVANYIYVSISSTKHVFEENISSRLTFFIFRYLLLWKNIVRKKVQPIAELEACYG
jgi:hypothetical protein